MARGWMTGLATCAALATCAGAAAQTTGFTTRAAFDAAVSTWTPQATNFDALPVGSNVAGGAGWTLAIAAGGLDAVVATGFWTTSAPNYLGENNADGQILNGDVLTFTFSKPVRAFGLYAIGGADMANFADVGVRLDAGSVAVTSSKTAEAQDGNGSFAFFVGLVSGPATPAFGSITLSGYSPGFMEYAVDDVIVAGVVPEPASWALLAAGLLVLARRRTSSLRHRQVAA